MTDKYLQEFSNKPDPQGDPSPNSAVSVGIGAYMLRRRNKTGTENYIFQLLNQFQEVTAPQGRWNLHRFTAYGAYGYPLYSSERFKVKYAENAVDILIDPEPLDLFHCPSQCFSLSDLLLLLKAKVSVITILDLILCKFPQYFPSEENYRKFMKIMELSVRLADRIIVPSQHTKSDLMAAFSVPETRIDVVYLACFNSFDSTAQKKFSRVIEEPYLLFVGSDYAHKNHEMLIRAYAKVKEKGWPDLHLVFAGPGRAGGRKEQVLAQLGQLESQVHWLEYVSDDQLSALYAGAQAYIFPSLYEGFGMTPLEAMSYGVPVAASNSTSIPEVVGEAALMMDAEDPDIVAHAIERVLVEPELRKELIEKGHQQTGKFSWAKTADETIACYQRALRESNRGKKITPELKKELLSLKEESGNPHLDRVVQGFVVDRIR